MFKDIFQIFGLGYCVNDSVINREKNLVGGVGLK